MDRAPVYGVESISLRRQQEVAGSTPAVVIHFLDFTILVEPIFNISVFSFSLMKNDFFNAVPPRPLGALSMDNPHPNPAPEWLSSQAWSDLCELDGLSDAFSGLRDGLKVSWESWT